MQLKKCFGIVSYLPDKEPARYQRINRLNLMLDKLHELWPDVPLIFIAQNWNEFKPKYTSTVFSYPRLGILKARRMLREKFLSSTYDYLIMMDDDAMIQCTDGSYYMNEIDVHPNGYGLFRHNKCPLMLLAISKYIYSQVDMPDIRAENNEGFEDDVFVASLLSKFPKSGFDFSHEHIEEISFKYAGEGAVPSTWAHEAQRDWQSMLLKTAQAINQVKTGQVISNDDIDLVVPYVDSNDPSWQQLYNKYNPDKQHLTEEVNAPSRFRGQGEFFRYFFRGIQKNIPWIKNIFLLVQSRSQVPNWINQYTVKIITHEQFIPKEFLPTFNSTTIEMFLQNIPGLSEKFLYANDDMFILQPLQKELFFYQDKIKAFTVLGNNNGMYGNQCLNSYRLGNGILEKDIHTANNLSPRFCHIVRPYLKSEVKKCYDMYKNEINKSITQFRARCNYNVYLFGHFMIKEGKQLAQQGICHACLYSHTSLSDVRSTFDNPKLNMICLEDDNNDINIYKNSEIVAYFQSKFPDKSLYEK